MEQQRKLSLSNSNNISITNTSNNDSRPNSPFITDLIADFMYKIIVIGPSGVGKSCLIYQFTEKSFLPTHDLTLGVEFNIKVVNVGGDEGKPKKKVKLQIWDTAGQESFRSITSNYYRGAMGAAIVYDITSRDTFTNLQAWIQEVYLHCTENVALILIGNKADLPERAVSRKEAEEFAHNNSIPLFTELSAKDNRGVENAFTSLAEYIYQSTPDEIPENTGKVDMNKKDKKSSCCE
eukprot:TRINITY_DN808_c0_g1_i2.p1 TRINITY_DN808_c0_g1~~TRINITY_DN808_c0_g1_i2.p1  ORF type:complete len:236 (+),score=49.73 TRINITY_DN808_c0_g1_i2:344-1051(+)